MVVTSESCWVFGRCVVNVKLASRYDNTMDQTFSRLLTKPQSWIFAICRSDKMSQDGTNIGQTWLRGYYATVSRQTARLSSAGVTHDTDTASQSGRCEADCQPMAYSFHSALMRFTQNGGVQLLSLANSWLRFVMKCHSIWRGEVLYRCVGG